MSLRLLLATVLLASAMPAFGQSLHETHVAVQMPNKAPITLYRPLTRNDCRVAQRHHQAGKMPLPVARETAEAGSHCATLLASRESAPTR